MADDDGSGRTGECVLVTQGFHSVAVPPGSQVYFLNYLVGELLDDDRGIPPYDDPRLGLDEKRL
jgi:5-deoxy-glucuronate isomerase